MISGANVKGLVDLADVLGRSIKTIINLFEDSSKIRNHQGFIMQAIKSSENSQTTYLKLLRIKVIWFSV